MHFICACFLSGGIGQRRYKVYSRSNRAIPFPCHLLNAFPQFWQAPTYVPNICFTQRDTGIYDTPIPVGQPRAAVSRIFLLEREFYEDRRKKVGEAVTYIETDEKYRSDCARKHMNEDYYIHPQFVYLSQDCSLCLAVDGDGLARGLPTNFVMEMKSPFWPIQKMVGTVVFLRTKNVTVPGEIWDYEIEDLTEDDCKFIEYYLIKIIKND